MMKNSKFKFLVLLTILFVAGGVSAEVDFNPEFEKVKSWVSYVPGIKVIRGTTQLIVPGHESFALVVPFLNSTMATYRFMTGDLMMWKNLARD